MKNDFAIVLASLLFAGAGSANADTVGAPMQRAQTIAVGVPHGADPIVLDAFTGAATLTTTTGSPRTYIGGVANFLAPGVPGPEVDITGLTVFVAATAAATYTNGIRIRVQLWDAYNPTSATAVYSSPAGAVIVADVPGPVTFTANTYSQIDIGLVTPVRLVGLNGKGYAINIQGDLGAGMASTDNLTTLLAAEAEGDPDPSYAVGANGIDAGTGFFRNVSNQTTFNFAASDKRTFTGLINIRAAVILRGLGNVPVSLQSFDVE